MQAMRLVGGRGRFWAGYRYANGQSVRAGFRTGLNTFDLSKRCFCAGNEDFQLEEVKRAKNQIRNFKYSAAQSELQRALQIYQQATGKFSQDSVHVLSLLSNTYQHVGDYESIVRLLLPLLEFLESQNRDASEQELLLLNNLCTAYENQQNYEKATETSRRLIYLCQKSGAYNALIEILLSDGRIKLLRGETSLKNTDEILQLVAQHVNQTTRKAVLKAAVYELQRDFASAETQLKNALHEFEQQDVEQQQSKTEGENISEHTNEKIDAWISLSKIQSELNKVDETEQSFQRALKLAENSGNIVYVAKILHELAKFYVKQSNAVLAEGLFKKSISLFQQHHLKHYASQVQQDYGSFLIKRGRSSEEAMQ